MNKEKLIDFLKKNKGKSLGIGIGLIAGIFIISIGVIKTIFMSICVYIGYFIGKKIDNEEDLLELLDKILPLQKYK